MEKKIVSLIYFLKFNENIIKAFSLDLQKADVDCNFVKVLKEQGAIFYCTSNVP